MPVDISSVRTDSVSPRSVFTVTGGGEKIKAFICGGIVFPAIRKDLRLPGIVCVVLRLENDEVYVLDLFQFNSYDFPLADFFAYVYDRFKLAEYVVRRTSDEDIEAVRFWQEMGRRQYRNSDKIYPTIRKIPIENDTQAFTPLISCGLEHKLHIESDLLKNAVGNYDPERPFDDAPHEIQALCLALVFASQRAWKVFESDRLERLEPKLEED